MLNFGTTVFASVVNKKRKTTFSDLRRQKSLMLYFFGSHRVSRLGFKK